MSDLENKKLDDSELEDVNGGGFFSDLVFRGKQGGRRTKIVTLEQKGKDNDWTLNTLEEKKITGNGFPKGFTGTSKL